MRELYWKILNTLQKHSSITKAAELLYMTQPTLTKRLQQMEHELGVQIAIRDTKGFVLTPQGDYLAGESGRMLREFQDIRDRLMFMSSGDSGTIALGVTNSFGRYFLPALLKQYRTTHENVSFEIKGGLSSQVMDMIENREVHIGFVSGETAYNFNGFMHLLHNDQVLAAASEPFHLEQMPQMPRVCYVIDSWTVKMIDRWWFSHFPIPYKIAVNVHNGDTCREMVESGLGYAIFPAPVFIKDSSQLFRIPLFKTNGQPLLRSAWVICKNTVHDIPLYRNFLDFIISQLVPVPIDNSPEPSSDPTIEPI